MLLMLASQPNALNVVFLIDVFSNLCSLLSLVYT